MNQVVDNQRLNTQPEPVFLSNQSKRDVAILLTHYYAYVILTTYVKNT